LNRKAPIYSDPSLHMYPI